MRMRMQSSAARRWRFRVRVRVWVLVGMGMAMLVGVVVEVVEVVEDLEPRGYDDEGHGGHDAASFLQLVGRHAGGQLQGGGGGSGVQQQGGARSSSRRRRLWTQHTRHKLRQLLLACQALVERVLLLQQCVECRAGIWRDDDVDVVSLLLLRSWREVSHADTRARKWQQG